MRLAVAVVLSLGCGGNAPPAAPTPAARPLSVAPRPSVPPEKVRAFAPGWQCITGVDQPHLSSCFKTEEQCTFGRETYVAGGLRYAGCMPQPRASCFVFVSVLKGAESFDCSATIAACEKQRAYALEQKADVRDVADCTPWE